MHNSRIYRLLIPVGFLLLLVWFSGCNGKAKKEEALRLQEQARQDSLAKVKHDSLVQDSIWRNTLHYNAFVFPKESRDSAMAEFLTNWDEKQRYVILSINRLDNENRWRADTLAVPDIFYDDFWRYSPFPQAVTELDSVKKIVLFSYPLQAFAYYERGKLLKWGPTSMGKESSKTGTGLHFTNWKKELAISTVNSSWKLPYNVNISNFGGIGWHQYDLPGFPASHACLRLLIDDAKWLYSIADSWVLTNNGQSVAAQGTPVIVYGEYDWNGRRPWLKLIGDAKANDISADEMSEIISPHLDKILAAQQNREAVAGPAKLVSDTARNKMTAAD